MPAMTSPTAADVRRGNFLRSIGFSPLEASELIFDRIARVVRDRPRQHEILVMTGMGMSNQAIAAKTGITEHAVRMHKTNLRRYLKVTYRSLPRVAILWQLYRHAPELVVKKPRARS